MIVPAVRVMAGWTAAGLGHAAFAILAIFALLLPAAAAGGDEDKGAA